MPELGLKPCESAQKSNDRLQEKCVIGKVMKSYLIWVFTGDPSSYDVSSWAWHTGSILKVYDGVTPGCFSIKQTDVLYSMKRDAHCNLQGVANTPLRLSTNPLWAFFGSTDRGSPEAGRLEG